MARTARAPHRTETRWNRCKPDCGCGTHPDPKFCNPVCGGKGCERDSKSRIQMREFAIRVTESLTGPMRDGMLICPITGMEFAIADGQVDKACAEIGYWHGNVVMVSIIGNQERSNLQKTGRDILGAARYASDVEVASQGLTILPISVALRMRDSVKGREIAKGEATGADAFSRHALEGPYGAY